jgi:Rps23 Pro-64 3,4-dihydroxylase Tpa1-like proline 4-hydroxylase
MINDLIPNFDAEHLASTYQSASPFPHICMSDFLEDSFAREVMASFPSVQEAQEAGSSSKGLDETEKKKMARGLVDNQSIFLPPVKKLHDLFTSDEFVSRLSTLTGIPNLLADPDMVGAGIHEAGPRDRLDVHLDFSFLKRRQLHRRLSLLIYFNDPWELDWGGNLELWDMKISNLYASFSPQFNQICLFTNTDISYHSVTGISCPDGQCRKDYSAYYYTKEGPSEWG